MAGNDPEERVRWPVVRQRWRSVSFVHWRYDPAVIARFLPPGVTPDVVDGSAWVGLTPFAVEGFTVPPLPPLPIVSRYPETNLRTYVRNADGVDGIWFLSLDVESVPTVLAARTVLAVPYHPARMRVVDHGGTVRYLARRLVGPRAGHDIEVRPGAPVQASERDEHLVGRWRAFIRRAGRLLAVPVRHEPWALHTAEVLRLRETLTAAAGLPPPEGEPIVHWSPGVHAVLGPPRPS